MKINERFSVPTQPGISEKYLYRVLITSLCSMLLCMGCLAGSTWAWFTADIDNTENVLVIDKPTAAVTVGGAAFESGAGLAVGTYDVVIEKAASENVDSESDFDTTHPLYVTFSADETILGYVVLNADNGYKATVAIERDQPCALSWSVSWFQPDQAKSDLAAPAEPSIESDETSEPSGEGEDEVREAADPTSEPSPTPTAEPAEVTESQPEAVQESVPAE